MKSKVLRTANKRQQQIFHEDEGQTKPKASGISQLFQDILNYKTLDEVLESLEENYDPPTIQCRDKQKSKIRQFVLQGIADNGASQSLYISGVPGIGKTLCVKEVTRSESERPNCKFVYVNAMNLKRPADFFKALLYELCKEHSHSTRAMHILNTFFDRGVTDLPLLQLISKMNKILVIDEIDFLATRDNDVLYNIFEWTMKWHSHLIVVSISNTIDFPEHLPDKIRSRMGSQRQIFAPYKSEQIDTIIKGRIGGNSIFEDKAIAYISKKITNNTSDIRKCLYILRQSIAQHQAKNTINYPFTKVPIQVLIDIHEEEFSNQFVTAFFKFPTGYKIVLNHLARYFKGESDTVPCSFRQLKSMCSQYIVQQGQLDVILDDLNDLGIISVKMRHMEHDKRYNQSFTNMKFLVEKNITLKVNKDHIFHALNKEEHNPCFNFTEL